MVHAVVFLSATVKQLAYIGQRVPKLCSNEKASSFLTHSVVRYM